MSEASAGGERSTGRAARQPATVPGAGDPRLDKGRLDILVQSYFVKGLAQSTNRVYACSQRQYITFCASTGLLAVLLGRTSCVGLSPRWLARA